MTKAVRSENKGKSAMSSLRVAVIAFLLLTTVALGAPTIKAQKGEDPKGGIVFKVPDGYRQMPFSNFRGALMLDLKRAAGMFVSYPNENETTEALRLRLLTTIGRMFIHGEKGKPQTELAWVTKSLTSHPGDGEGQAAINTHSETDKEVQITIYERTGGSKPLLYGYFAMRHKLGKDDDGKFLDDQGQGVKAFDKLWRSFAK